MPYVFGAYHLDPQRYELHHAGVLVPLRPKVFQVLAYLVARHDQVVRKEELLEALWPGQFVGDVGLNTYIMEVRKALGDRRPPHQYLRTVRGQGYRFIAPVRAQASPEGPGVMGALRAAPPPRFRHPRHFVGRDAELAQLVQGWTTARQGTRQMGVIAGEPGIGKTALVEAFLAQVAAGGDCRVGHGQCIEPYGPGEPYLPVLEAFGRLCREPDGLSLVALLRQCAPSWLVQMPALLPPAEWEALQRTIGHPAQTRMLRELTEVLDTITIECPLVLVLEDLHWSDRATLEWLAYVARRPDPARLMILGTYRPVDAMIHAHPLRTVLTELQQHGQCVELPLDYLSEVEVTTYLHQRFGGIRLAADLGRVLHQRTHGNPLFLIAVVDEIVRRQGVREGPEGWAIPGGVETISVIIPATLRALVEQQLAHCSPEEQTLLEAASVAGVEFAAATVAASLERADDAIEAQCATLAQQGQFLQARGRAEWSDGTVTACFGFRHALYHDILYQRIPAGRQTRWHARIGARLEQGFGARAGDIAAALAMHFVRGRLLPQAVQYLRQAGEKAVARSAHREAVGYFEQALSALPHLPATRDTREQAIDLRFALRSALRLLDHRALVLATTSGDGVLHALTNPYLGITYHVQGDYHRALACLKQTIVYLDEAHRHERFGQVIVPAANSRPWSAVCHAELGMFIEGRVLGDEGLRIAEEVAHPASLINAYRGVGLLALRQGDLPRALTALERAMSIGQAADVPIPFLNIAPDLGAAYTLAGRVAAAVPLLTQALEQILAQGIGENLVFCRLSLAEAHILDGHLVQGGPAPLQETDRRKFAAAEGTRSNKVSRAVAQAVPRSARAAGPG